MPPVGFEPTISVGERPQTYFLDRAGTETFHISFYDSLFGFYLYRVIPEQVIVKKKNL
jgi:hypothetical protein